MFCRVAEDIFEVVSEVGFATAIMVEKRFLPLEFGEWVSFAVFENESHPCADNGQFQTTHSRYHFTIFNPFQPPYQQFLLNFKRQTQWIRNSDTMLVLGTPNMKKPPLFYSRGGNSEVGFSDQQIITILSFRHRYRHPPS